MASVQIVVVRILIELGWYTEGMNVKHRLQQAHIRSTPGREAVLTMISRAKHPVSIQEIQTDRSVAALQLDEVSLYRITKMLTDNHILRQIDFHEGKFRYELDDNHHHHVVCTRCGRVKDVEVCLDEKTQATIAMQTGYNINSHALEFFGLCDRCQ